MSTRLILFVTLFLVFQIAGPYFFESHSAPPGDREISTVTGLDFDKVMVLVSSRPEFRQPLYTYAIDKLTKAGIYNRNTNEATSEKIATLMVTLDPSPLTELCPSKVAYVKKLELWEKVFPERNSKVSVSAVTWSYGHSIPDIRDKVTIEQLEADLDRFLSEFIRSYKMGNPIKK